MFYDITDLDNFIYSTIILIIENAKIAKIKSMRKFVGLLYRKMCKATFTQTYDYVTHAIKNRERFFCRMCCPVYTDMR